MLAWMVSGVGFLFIFGLYTLIFRALLHYVSIGSDNFWAALVIKATDWLVFPFDKILGRVRTYRHLDISALLAFFFLDIIRFYVLGLLKYAIILKPSLVLLTSVSDVVVFSFSLLSFAFLLRILIGWFPKMVGEAFRAMVFGLTHPLMNYSREWIVPMGGYDFLPFFWLMLLQAFSFFLYVSMPLHF